MPLSKRAVKNFENFNLPLSFRVNESSDKFRDCSNVFSNQGRLETRYGTELLTSADVGTGEILSISFFKKADRTSYIIYKVGTEIKAYSSGVVSTIKTGLTSTTKHRGISLNDRHIISVENDGLFSFNGTAFTQLGQSAPTAPTGTIAAGGSLTDGSVYSVKITYYSSATAFESNASSATADCTATAANKTIALTVIPTTALNGTIDQIKIYLKKSTGPYYYHSTIALGGATASITTETTSTLIPPTANAMPLSGGGKFLVSYMDKLVYAGNSTYKNDVIFSESELPDAFDDGASRTVLFAKGNGPITGLGVGYYNNSILEPYIVVFKRGSFSVYSERDDFPRFVEVENNVGCISHETIKIRNGDIIFQSLKGWHVITNGAILKDQKSNVVNMGNGDIDDLYTSPGFFRYLNKANTENFHSTYYPALDQYICWISEAGSLDLTRAYVYEFGSSNGFKAYDFPFSASCSCQGEDAYGNPMVLIGATSRIFCHSLAVNKNDRDEAGSQVAINASAIITWSKEWDHDATYNYREIIVRGVSETFSTIEVRGAVNFLPSNYASANLQFIPASDAFILDVSQLDVTSFGEGRVTVTARADINKVGESISIGLYQNVMDGNMELSTMQLHYSKNGNRNI